MSIGVLEIDERSLVCALAAMSMGMPENGESMKVEVGVLTGAASGMEKPS